MFVGVSGAGKTSVEHLLVDTPGVDFLGTDDIVENTLRASIIGLVIRNVPGSIEARKNTVLRALTGPGAVVTLGTSQVEDEQAPRVLHDAKTQGTRVVELSVEISKFARRQGLNVSRSLALSAPKAQFAMIMRTLRARYLDTADSSIQTGGHEPRQIAESVVWEYRLTGDS